MFVVAIPLRPAEAQTVLTFAYLQKADDPHYQRRRAYTGLVLRDQHPPLDGVKLALPRKSHHRAVPGV